MVDAVRDGTGRLPDGLKVTWRWRNTAGQSMRSGDFQSVVRDSGGKGSTQPHAGFLTLMERRLTRDAARFAPGFSAPPPPREATAKEERAIDRAEELAAEEREAKGHRKGEATRRREEKRSQAEKRSIAAKKGAETKRKERERAARLAEALKRSKAAKKAAATRKANKASAAARKRAAAPAKKKRGKSKKGKK